VAIEIALQRESQIEFHVSTEAPKSLSTRTSVVFTVGFFSNILVASKHKL
jgi:hypothetical protein